MALGIGIGIPFIRVSRGAAIDAQAQAHFDRVIADGGQVPSGLSGVNAFFTTIKSIYATSDITTAISVGLDAQVLGYKLGAGAGTTAGQAAQKLYSCSGASGDVVQTTAASQPLLLVHEGDNYGYLPAVSNNFFSTPSALANQFIDNFGVQAELSTIAANGRITGKDNVLAGNRQYAFTYSGTTLGLVIYNTSDVAFTYTSTANIPFSSGQYARVGFTRNGTTGDVKFFISLDGVTWTQLGSTISGITGSLATSNVNVQIGLSRNSTAMLDGKFYKIRYYKDDTFTTPTQIFDASQYNAATSQTQWNSSTGEVWAINTGTAANGYKGVLVDRTIMQGDGIDDTLTNAVTFGTLNKTYYVADKIFVIGSSRTSGGLNNLNGGVAQISPTNKRFWYDNGNFTIETAGANVNRLNLSIGSIANGSQLFRINNGSDVTATTALLNSNQLSVLFGSFGFSNTILNNFILTSQVDTTQKTAMYNYIKSINNNAF
jgi:hypothetical protein